MKIFLIFFFVLIAQTQATWEMKAPKGFLWYNEDKIPPKEKIKNDPNKVVPSASPKTYKQKMDAFKAKMEEIQARAILDPTLRNVQAFKEIQEESIDRATLFSKIWLLANQLQNNLREEDNSDNQFRKIYAQQEQIALEKDIKALSKDFGLFFLFKGGCPYCHQFAPIVKSFAAHYQFEVKAISADDGKLDVFKNSVKDNGICKFLNPEQVYPALFLANPKTGEVIPVAWGLVSEDQLKQNIRVVLEGIRTLHDQ